MVLLNKQHLRYIQVKNNEIIAQGLRYTVYINESCSRHGLAAFTINLRYSGSLNDHLECLSSWSYMAVVIPQVTQERKMTKKPPRYRRVNLC